MVKYDWFKRDIYIYMPSCHISRPSSEAFHCITPRISEPSRIRENLRIITYTLENTNMD